tara:strand:+ start:476 stop:721 length:246 start_codon:yes stop_codon:yes gene_type:complete
MRIWLACLLLLGGCNTMEVLDKARTPAEAYYLMKKKDGDKSVNPYDNDPKYAQVYCTVKGIEFRTTAAACTESDGIAIPVN